MSDNNMDDGSILIPKISLVEKFMPKDKKELSKDKHVGLNSRKRKVIKVALITASVFVIFILITALLSFNVYRKGLVFRTSMTNLENAVKEQDLAKVKIELIQNKKNLESVRKSYNSLAYTKIIPFVGNYYTDGIHGLNSGAYSLEAGEILVSVVEPYADIIGFKTEAKSGENAGGKTAQERIDFIVKTLPDLVPRTDELIEKSNLIKNEVDQINPDRYPEKFQGKEVRQKIKETIELVDQVAVLLKNSKPLLERSPSLMGADKEKKYLILFQNDKELRPTGGFLTAYSIGKVDKGRFEPVVSSDIYNLDSSYKPHIKAAEPIVKYLKGPYALSPNLRLRDMNWSPSFKESMELFTKEAKSAGLEGYDGVISVDTQVLVNLLNVTGPIDVPGFGNFSTNIIPECNCPQVIYELESFADVEGPVVWSQDEPGKIIFAPPNYDNRKKIIGPLMNSVLANILAQPSEKFPSLFEAVLKSLTEKHILFYLLDAESQKAVDEFGIAGTIKDFDGDYLHINDANLGGRKSNLYVTQEVLQEINIDKEGKVTKTLTITYKNPEKHDGWLNSVLPNWVRIYVPKGSKLISFDGVEEKESPYEEHGKSVFAGFFQLRPQGAVKITLKYELPFKASKELKMFIQKQPGKDKLLYTVEIGKKTDEFFLLTDKEVKYKLP